MTRDASRLTGLPSGMPIIAGGGDGQAAGVGANALSPKCAYLNLGTAVVAGIYGRRYRTNKAFRTMCACSENGYYYECSLRAGTFAVDWLVQKVLRVDRTKQPAIYRELEQEAEQISPGCDGLIARAVFLRSDESLLGYECEGNFYRPFILPSPRTSVSINSGGNRF